MRKKQTTDKGLLAAVAALTVCVVALTVVAVNLSSGAGIHYSAQDVQAEVLGAEEIVSSNDVNVKYARIGALGDSISAGYHLGMYTDDGIHTPSTETFVNYLAIMANKNYKGPVIAENCLELGICDDLAGARLHPELPILNYAVPGAASFDVLVTKPNFLDGDFNITDFILGFPEGLNFLRGAESEYIPRTALEQLVADEPTFSSLWIGNNDILYYATGGGGDLPYTPPAQFGAIMYGIAQQLAPLKTTVAIANIPNIKSIPHFKDLDGAATLANYYYGTSLDGATVGYLTGVGSDDLLTLKAFAPSVFASGAPDFTQSISFGDILIGQQYGIDLVGQLDGRFYLDTAEQVIVDNAVIAYNGAIAQIAAANENFILIDINSFFDDISANGVDLGLGVNLYPEVGLFFDTDGVHPDPVGHALIANFFAETLNAATDGADLPLMNVAAHAAANGYFGPAPVLSPSDLAPGQDKLANTLGKAFKR